ncbi:CocE/NonD family hydrolase [Bradyrhizobium jicamae]|uniref:CocE/NonD family hydrolase n=1 Tax=Bradyrhizobium jicamae TaxID=280332 RepID=UPI001BACF39C|nr:CocE/NonD family hydrolase [Bradyrhizobium jicamae]MBR0752161.1 CocE/NonD family hydrolase [Bradyrhizobium jicamae]
MKFEQMTAEPFRLPVLPSTIETMTLKDGTRLDADVYRPAARRPFPVLLQRQAYSRRIACSICYAHPAWYASHGYIVVVQDVRGRGTSEGTFRPGESEIEDGAEAVEWAARLDGANGDVAMYGFSYQAYNQLLTAAGNCPSLKALAPAMGPWNPAQWAYENGAFQMKHMISWGIQIAAETARRAGDDEAFSALQAAASNLPLGGPIASMPELLRKHRHYSHVMDWLETPADSPYWASISPVAHVDAIRARRLPMLFVGGWFDPFLPATVESFRSLARSSEDTRLIVGPWIHFPWTRKVGSVDFGAEAQRNVDIDHIRFFDCVLKGSPNRADHPRIELFDMGLKKWRACEDLPTSTHSLFLDGTGRASMDPRDGTLGSRQGTADHAEHIVHDPWRPAPTVGGYYGVPTGPVDRRVTDERGDVLTFTTDTLEDAVEVVGEPEVELELSCDRPSFDLCCILSLVTSDERVHQISSGYAHYRVATAGRYRLKLATTCATLGKGERLRLSIAGADYPAYPVNPGTGEDPVSTPKSHAVVTTIALWHGPERPSLLRLPVGDGRLLASTGLQLRVS